MKSITEILGGSQMLLGISYEIQDIFEEYLTEEHRTFLALLRLLEAHQPQFCSSYQGRVLPYRVHFPQKATFSGEVGW